MIKIHRKSILITKANEMHHFPTLFGKELSMFRIDLLPIISSLNTVFTAIGICHTSYVDSASEARMFHPDLACRQSRNSAFVKQILPTALGSICLTNACCSMYSLELLMMDGKTVQNM